MLSPKIAAILLLFVALQNNLSAQDKLNIKFGKVTSEDFNVVSPLIDSSANAVVIADMGKSIFVADRTGLKFTLEFTEKKRIKILTKNGFDAATVEIPLYVDNNGRVEKLSDLTAFTYTNENGKVQETKLDKASVFSEQQSKHWLHKKFTFPAIKEGCIIEYSYKITSDFLINLQPWTFQGPYPVLWSQYEANIPDFFKYVTLTQGYQPYFIDNVKKEKISFSFVEHEEIKGGSGRAGAEPDKPKTNYYNLTGETDFHTWVMKDVPALKDETFTTTLRNSNARIEFQLNQIAYPDLPADNYMNTWETVAVELMREEKFGVAINKANGWLENDGTAAAITSATDMQKALNIFEYVRDNFSCNHKEGIFITTTLKDVNKNKTGSVSDINMLMIAMLKAQKIEAYPVILSTRDNGRTHDFYPLMNRYNYVIAKVVIENKVFFLDATEAKLPFGKLPSQVYNGQARVIAEATAAPIYFSADSLKETGFTRVFIGNMDNGGVEGSFSQNKGFYESLDLRDEMTKTKTDEFKKSMQSGYVEDIAIDNIQIDSLRSLNQPVAVKFNLKLTSFSGNNDIVYFNPMMHEAVKKNPFTAAERFYPVEMPYTIDDTYTLMMEIPKGYTVDELPKSVRFNLNENEGMFEYLISSDGKQIQMQRRLLLNKATYTNDDYQTLREFYAFIVKKESEQIVFKKIK